MTPDNPGTVASDLTSLAADLEAGRLTAAEATSRAGRMRPDRHVADQVRALSVDAVEAYTAGQSRKAWSTATVLAGVIDAWGRVRSRPWPLRGGMTEGVFDLQARALALLSLIEADAGRADSAADLRRQFEDVLGRLSNPSPARLAIATLWAERAIRLGRGEDAVATMQEAVRLPGLDDAQRAAAQVVLATSLRAAGRPAEGVAMLEHTAEDFARAGLPSAALASDLERAVRLLDAGRTQEARSLLAHVAQSAAVLGEDELEADARLRLGALASKEDDHAEAAEQFARAGEAARREGNDAKVVVALRNAADELRQQHDFEAADRVLQEVFAIESTAALEVDLAKAKITLAVLRERQGRKADAAHLLVEAETTFRQKLDSLERTESPRTRQHLEAQLRQVVSLRERLGLPST